MTLVRCSVRVVDSEDALVDSLPHARDKFRRSDEGKDKATPRMTLANNV